MKNLGKVVVVEKPTLAAISEICIEVVRISCSAMAMRLLRM